MATKSKFGEKEYVEWHSVVAFRELAKEVVEKCTKGRFIRVYGYLHHSNGGNDGAYKTEVVATRIKYLESARSKPYGAWPRTPANASPFFALALHRDF